MAPNSAAFLVGHQAKPLQVRDTDDRYPDEDEILVKNAAIAINRLDWKMQSYPWTSFEYPLILGADVAGEVVDVVVMLMRVYSKSGIVLSATPWPLPPTTSAMLPPPSLDPSPTSTTLLIWGGSSSAGCNAIQLAVAAGCEVTSRHRPGISIR
ncbi:hypothetical protein F5144DRAFT_566048 [Chaetomium tenue]|uniref:Uncharacterized protein n=1 Tax=Chaetomium tenue TaxID=1854479 RepID=A0ACB7PEC5_9PEZI|nr:hypothetical protein F5144DRAFT_566048 [Chaetomium globosum]